MRPHDSSLPFILHSPSFILLFLLAIFPRPVPAGEHELKLRMQKKIYHAAAGETLRYRIYVPRNYDPRDKYPLILFLHGIDGRGQDNEAQLKHPEVLRLISDGVQVRYPCFLVAPQCPKDEKWVDVPWGSPTPHPTPAEPTAALRRVMELLDSLDKQFSTDPARHYVTGITMGAFAAVECCLRRPEYWAAAFPVCGGGDDSRAADLAKIPMWFFHGERDTAVPVQRARSMIAALKAANGSARYSEYSGLVNVWQQAYNDSELPGWLFSQQRKP
jgi:predicted peptidase